MTGSRIRRCGSHEDTAQDVTSCRMTVLFTFILILLLVPFGVISFIFRDRARAIAGVTIIPVCSGWARNTVNTSIFRQSSLTSHDGFQYIAFYDGNGFVLLGKRALGSTEWTVRKTDYRGNPVDAHNVISIGIDGRGIIHMAWDMHDRKLRYCQSREPGSLEMTEKLSMTGLNENRVSYPQFYNLSDGSLLFLYRLSKEWLQRSHAEPFRTRRVVPGRHSHHPLISGEGWRNPYTNNLVIDHRGGLHLSWCWRESSDVATNHDICYACSPDGGRHWYDSAGAACALPFLAGNSERAWAIPQGSDLINQSSMAADSNCRPIISTSWRKEGTGFRSSALSFTTGPAGVRFRSENEEPPLHSAAEERKPFPSAGPGSWWVPMTGSMCFSGTVTAATGFAWHFPGMRDGKRGMSGNLPGPPMLTGNRR